MLHLSQSKRINRKLAKKGMILRPITLATIESLKRANWFARVGENLTDAGKISVPVTIVSSWKEAVRQCEGDEWNLVLNESANEFRNRLVRASKEEFCKWNDQVKAANKIGDPLVAEKLKEIQKEHVLFRRRVKYAALDRQPDTDRSPVCTRHRGRKSC